MILNMKKLDFLINEITFYLCQPKPKMKKMKAKPKERKIYSLN